MKKKKNQIIVVSINVKILKIKNKNEEIKNKIFK